MVKFIELHQSKYNYLVSNFLSLASVSDSSLFPSCSSCSSALLRVCVCGKSFVPIQRLAVRFRLKCVCVATVLFSFLLFITVTVDGTTTAYR